MRLLGSEAVNGDGREGAMNIKAVIFDLDGVIVSTDRYHYRAWKQIADQEGIEFNSSINHRLRGVSRMESLEILLERASRDYLEEEKQQLAEQKNEVYKGLLASLTADDLLPEVRGTLLTLRERKVKIAIGSSSKNAPLILDKIGLSSQFDAISDGNNISQSKPHPEVFLKAAEMLGVAPEDCLVVEDAEAGVEAALRAGMKAAAIGDARNSDKAHYKLLSIRELLRIR